LSAALIVCIDLVIVVPKSVVAWSGEERAVFSKCVDLSFFLGLLSSGDR